MQPLLAGRNQQGFLLGDQNTPEQLGEGFGANRVPGNAPQGFGQGTVPPGGGHRIQEGIAVRASDIDVVYVYGYGWPVYRGGPMHYANSLGLDKVVAKLRHYQEATGDDFWQPSALLLELAEKGQGFS